MKIIGKTTLGFIVEMSTQEISVAAGFGRYANSQKWLEAPGVNRSTGEPFIGTTIDVLAAYDFHSRIMASQASALSAAASLHTLAGLIEGAMPEVVLPPPAEPKPEEPQA